MKKSIITIVITFITLISLAQNKGDSSKNWLSFHFQQTTVYQMQPGVSGNYSSDFSLSPKGLKKLAFNNFANLFNYRQATTS